MDELMEEKFVTLVDLQAAIREELENSFPSRVWVKAEVSALQARANGHCYMELSQTEDGRVVAKVRAVCWRNVWLQLSAYFTEATGSSLREGMTVLLEVNVSYSEIYGLSLVVTDLNPDFTLGEKERQKQLTIKRLEDEGLMTAQKEFVLPHLPYRIAVISAADAAGYRDFRRHLDANEYGFVWDVELYQAAMQGESAPASVSDAFARIESSGIPYDCVMLLRGGGSKLDLDCFNEYELAAAVARCPFPVITGLGHDQDFHIADMVACHYVKTPTALAAWLIDLYAAEDESLAYYGTRLKLAFLNKVAAMESRVEMLGTRILSADPRNILKRGYTLTLDVGGKVARSAASFRSGDTLRVLFPDGGIEAIVK